MQRLSPSSILHELTVHWTSYQIISAEGKREGISGDEAEEEIKD